MTTYVMLIIRGETYKRINQALVDKHIEYIRNLDGQGRLVLAGATKGFPKVGGMIIFKAKDEKAAKAFCQGEPFVAEGHATFKMFTIRLGNKENNYLAK